VPKKGNYNQDHYKIRGKEPGNQDIQPERTRQEYEIARRKPGLRRRPTQPAGRPGPPKSSQTS
jgi:hypothetical protein